MNTLPTPSPQKKVHSQAYHDAITENRDKEKRQKYQSTGKTDICTEEQR